VLPVVLHPSGTVYDYPFWSDNSADTALRAVDSSSMSSGLSRRIRAQTTRSSRRGPLVTSRGSRYPFDGSGKVVWQFRSRGLIGPPGRVSFLVSTATEDWTGRAN
jgi:hypothetical protein